MTVNNNFREFFNNKTETKENLKYEEKSGIKELVKKNFSEIAKLTNTNSIKLSFVPTTGKIILDTHALVPQSITNLTRALIGVINKKVNITSNDNNIENLKTFCDFIEIFFSDELLTINEAEELNILIAEAQEGLETLKIVYDENHDNKPGNIDVINRSKECLDKAKDKIDESLKINFFQETAGIHPLAKLIIQNLNQADIPLRPIIEERKLIDFIKLDAPISTEDKEKDKENFILLLGSLKTSDPAYDELFSSLIKSPWGKEIIEADSEIKKEIDSALLARPQQIKQLKVENTIHHLQSLALNTFSIITQDNKQFLVNKEHVYKIINPQKAREIGRGAFGSVAVVKNLVNNNKEIFKTAEPSPKIANPRASSTGDSQFKEALQNEHTILSELNKNQRLPGIQPTPHQIFTYSHDQIQKEGYLTEKFDGDMTRYLDKTAANKFGLEDKFNMCSKLLDGLSAVHARNIFHKDIKPQNIYLRENDKEAVIGDWGSAVNVENPAIFFENLLKELHGKDEKEFAECLYAGGTRPYFPNIEEAEELLKTSIKLKNSLAASKSPEEISKINQNLAEVSAELVSFMKKADVYALGVSLAQFIRSEKLKMVDKPMTPDCMKRQNAYLDILLCGEADGLKLLLKGMTEMDYKKRLTAEQAMKMLKDIKNAGPLK
jgi:serine/threonine protein kinase